MEQLSQRGLENIYSDKLFKQYQRKVRKQTPYSHPYYAALRVFDMFVTNAPVS